MLSALLEGMFSVAEREDLKNISVNEDILSFRLSVWDSQDAA